MRNWMFIKQYSGTADMAAWRRIDLRALGDFASGAFERRRRMTLSSAWLCVVLRTTMPQRAAASHCSRRAPDDDSTTTVSEHNESERRCCVSIGRHRVLAARPEGRPGVAAGLLVDERVHRDYDAAEKLGDITPRLRQGLSTRNNIAFLANCLENRIVTDLMDRTSDITLQWSTAVSLRFGSIY